MARQHGNKDGVKLTSFCGYSGLDGFSCLFNCDLFTQEVLIEPESLACPDCQGKLHVIGDDVSEMLDVVPAILHVKRIRRPRYGCRACESAVVLAKAPLLVNTNQRQPRNIVTV